MNSRYIGSIFLTPLIIFLIVGGSLLQYVVLFLSLMGLYEFYKVVELKNIKPLKYFGYAATILYFNLLGKVDFSVVAFVIFLSLMILMCVPAIKPEYNFIDVGVTILGFIYVSVFFSFIALINQKTNGEYLVWFIFISSWLSDTTAYYSGKFFGKHKLCPRVSPKKTIEGSIGGLIGSVVGCVILGIIMNNNGINISIVHCIILGIVSGVFSQFGDLAASSVKRYCEVKDYSNLIPGHGGILDRFDSILFSAVVVYYYLTFIINI